jgi:hypothetical protein
MRRQVSLSLAISRWLSVILLALFTVACSDDTGDDSARDKATDGSGDSAASAAEPETDEVERFKPAEGMGNVQGTVRYNGKPAAGIEVTLCEEFNRWGSGCGGKTYTATTDSSGIFVVRDVPPKEYAALLAKVFDSDSYVFATTGIVGLSSETHAIEANKTLFVKPINLFKSDLKVMSPKAGTAVTADGLTLSWEPYPDAEHYTLSLFPDSSAVESPYINQRVDSSAFVVSKPLVKGEYRLQIDAFNAADVKLAESADNYTFTVN